MNLTIFIKKCHRVDVTPSRTKCSYVLLVFVLVLLADAKRAPPSGGAAIQRGGRSSPPRGKKGGRSGSGPTSRRRALELEDEDEYDMIDEEKGDFLDEYADEYDPLEDEEVDILEEEEIDILDDMEDERLSSRGKQSRRGHPARSAAKSGRGRASTVQDELYDDEEDEYDDFAPPSPRRSGPSGGRRPSGSSRKKGPAAPSSRSSSRRGSGGRRGAPHPSSRRGGRGAVVPYGSGPPQPTAFARGLTTLQKYIPDPGAVKDATLKAASAATSVSSSVTKGLYREIKGLTSSELEQVMLKATKPDDSPVKGKHVERLVGVTYQISARYDIYDAVLRKLWKKMLEPDWRTKVKALYVLHRFSADGAPAHGPALKARLRELRRTKDPKSKERFFNSKQLLAGDNSPDSSAFRAFTARYAHYVLLRAQCFAGMFTEIVPEESAPASGKASRKSQSSSSSKGKGDAGPVTSSALRNEHLEASRLLLKAASACTLKDGEVCENTAFCVERVAVDMMGLTAAVATALNRCIKSPNYAKNTSINKDQIKAWCQFYSEELLPQTKTFVKKATPKLDAYGLFLPTRLGASVSQDVLKIGLEGASIKGEEEEEGEEEEKQEVAPVKATEERESTAEEKETEEEPQSRPKAAARLQEPDEEEDDEYEYEYEYEDEDDL